VGQITKVFPLPASNDYTRPWFNLDIKTLSIQQTGKDVTQNVAHKIINGVLSNSLSLIPGINTETSPTYRISTKSMNRIRGCSFMDLSKLGIIVDQSGCKSELLDYCK
jgi:hypothetical protein